jgi:hypothetical protein
MFRNLKPFPHKRRWPPEAVNYESFEYKPQDAKFRYFLMQFVTRHYSRRRAAVRENYGSSPLFSRALYGPRALEGKFAASIIESNRKNKTIETFLVGEGDQIEIIVRNISIEDLLTPPYKAMWISKRSSLLPAATSRQSASVTSQTSYSPSKNECRTRSFRSIRLVFTIVYFREDQASS